MGNTDNQGTPPLRITRLFEDIELIAPAGYHASVLLKRIESAQGGPHYAWWAMVAQNNAEQISVSYKHVPGGDTIRVDLPCGIPLSATALEPHLADFLTTTDGVTSSDPPIIRD